MVRVDTIKKIVSTLLKIKFEIGKKVYRQYIIRNKNRKLIMTAERQLVRIDALEFLSCDL